jgi:hypothetical protein
MNLHCRHFLAKIDRSITGGFPALLVPDLVDRMLEDVERGLRETVSRNPQHIVGLHGAVSHDRAEFYRLVAYALGWGIVAEQGGDHVGNDTDIDRRLAAVRLQPQVEEAVVDEAIDGGFSSTVASGIMMS